MGFLDDYEPVETRIAKFYAQHPEGRIITELVSFDGEQWVFKASVFRGVGDFPAAATGYAHEVTTQRGVNATSACENCETSAIGRALANLNYAAKGKRPSQQEMGKTRSGPPAGPGVKVGAKASSPRTGESGDVPAGGPVVGEATLQSLQARVSALVADKVGVADARTAAGLPPLKPGLTDDQAKAWAALLDDLEVVQVSQVRP
jgi:hypothetical protein